MPPVPPAAVPSALQDILNRTQKHRGVVGYVIAGPDESVVSTTLSPALARAYASAAPALGRAARAAVRDLDPRDDLAFMRLRTARHELAVAARDSFTLVVVQSVLGGAGGAC